MITPLAIILGLILIFGIAQRYGYDSIWFLFVCIAGVFCSYMMTTLPLHATWWIIGKLAG